MDGWLRLKLADLDPRQFEEFFLHFLAARPDLTVLHHGRTLTRRVVTATTYAAGSGRDQRGIDLRLEMEGGEVWGVQCKRRKKWTASETREAIEAAVEFPAHHSLLVVACDVGAEVHDLVALHGEWTLWNLDTICAEFRLRVPRALQPKCLPFLSPSELRKFLPHSTDALISPDEFFKGYLGAGVGFRHDWKMVGRQKALDGLMGFLAEDENRVLLLTARGGEGKSRLLLELSRRLAQEPPDAYEVLCLNPASSGDQPEVGLVTEAKKLVILVDDAHRVENLPRWLLEWVRRDPKAKVILAARPQGREAMRSELDGSGVGSGILEQDLASLTSIEIRELATEVLGEGAADRVSWLLERTRDSPFLTVTAGGLLREGQIQMPSEMSDDEFRRRVLSHFETSNLEVIPEMDRARAQALLRLIALLSPVEGLAEFPEKAARCLDWTSFDVETALRRLRAIQLLSGDAEKLRVVPDLFADFLVYDLCFGTGMAADARMNRILGEFGDQGPVMLRNLAEAAWLARRDGKEDPGFMDRLLQAEQVRFESAGFGARADILRHWAEFSVFLPREALNLVQRAMALDTAPADPEEGTGSWFGNGRSTHAAVLRQLPALLEPIALYHTDLQSEALDFLWDLGFVVDWKERSDARKQAWAALANVLSFQKWKQVEVTALALEWLGRRLTRGESLRVLEDPESVLRTLLGPCFARTVETREQAGAAISFTKWAVSIARTQPVRDRAIGILHQVIHAGSWMAALDAISAAGLGFLGIPRIPNDPAGERDAYRECWRPERLQAVGVLREALLHHPHVAVRVRVRMELRQLAAWDEDPAVCDEARRIESEVGEDLDLELAGALLRRASLTAEELQTDRPFDDAAQKELEDLKKLRLQALIHQVVEAYDRPENFAQALEQLLSDLIRAGEFPETYDLYAALSQEAPDYAAKLGGYLVALESGGPLVRSWPLLVEGNRSLTLEEQSALFQEAARSVNPDIKSELVDQLSWRLRRDDADLGTRDLDLVERLVAGANVHLSVRLLPLVRWAPSKHLDWAWRLLLRLPLAELARTRPDALVELLGQRSPPAGVPPAWGVRHVLAELVHAPRLDFGRSAGAWEPLLEAYAREVYDLVVARIERMSAGDAAENYKALPDSWPSDFMLPAIHTHPDYAAICEALWRRVTDAELPMRHEWTKLFHAVVVGASGPWIEELRRQVERCPSVDHLSLLTRLLRFSGSLVIFRCPELARTILERAESLGGTVAPKRIWAHLYATAGPNGRSHTNGRLKPDDDYVEAEAIRAAEAHAEDPVIGPFYRWVVQAEQEQRRRIEDAYRTQMEALGEA